MVIFVQEQIRLTNNRMKLIEETLLLSGELIIEGRLIDASNATLFGYVQQELNKQIPVVYKPIAGERPLWDFPEGTLADREVAAFLLSKQLGLDLVPTTVLRDGPFGRGAVQQWIDIDESVDVVEYGQRNTPQIRSMALFDVIINNTDRKFGHLLIDKDGNCFGCDHGVTFHEEFKLRTVLWQFAGSPLLPEEQRVLHDATDWLSSPSSVEFRKHLSEAEISALEQRIQELFNEGFPYPSPEWPAVPWPPV